MPDYVLHPVTRAVCTRPTGKSSSLLQCAYFFITLTHLSTQTAFSSTFGACTNLP